VKSFADVDHCVHATVDHVPRVVVDLQAVPVSLQDALLGSFSDPIRQFFVESIDSEINEYFLE
jgi:hypothetical protein